MISKWQAAYEIIRFTGYTFFNFDNQTGVIWLKDNQADKILTITDQNLSDEELEQISENIFESKAHLSNLVGFKITNIKNIYLTDEKFSLKHKKDGLKISHKGISDLSSILANPFYKLEVNNKKQKQDKYYIRRLMSGHPLEVFMMKFTPMTSFLITLNLIVFLIAFFKVNISDDIMFVNRLAVGHSEVLHGELYRLLTSAFLHVGVEHFLLNMAALYILGKVVETLYGSYRLFIAYVAIGILSSLFSLMFLTDAISLGASGAVYGLLGIAIVHLLVYKKVNAKLLLQIALIFIVISLLTSIFSNVNHFAHLGGIIFGLLFGILYNPARFKKRWYTLTFISIIVLALLSYIIMYEEEPVRVYDEQAMESIENGDYEQALSYVNLTIQEDEETALTYHALSLLYEEAGDTEKADEYREKSYDMDSKNEYIIKEQLIQLRKERDYEGMETLINRLDTNNIKDEELQLLVEEFETNEE
jgi:rhomboid protease GluP